MRRAFIFLFFLIISFNQKSFASKIKYEEILDNPSDLELNLNYAKQQESEGNLKLTIATLERLSMLYPKNTEIKLYLLSILVNMDSKIKVDLMVKTLLNDPNVTDETKRLVIELLTTTDQVQEIEKKQTWFAYLDLGYSQTEENNISAITNSKQLWTQDDVLPFTKVDDKLTVGYDKTYKRNGALTYGKNLDDTSSIFVNLGLDVNTNNKKKKGESDIQSGSISYFKAIRNHYLSPYFYYNDANYRHQEDYVSKGIGFNNTYIINNKNNLNYSINYSESKYKNGTGFESAYFNDRETVASNIRYNYNISNQTQLSAKIIKSNIESGQAFDGYDSEGIGISASTIFPIGTLSFRSTYLENEYDERETLVNSSIDRFDESYVTVLSLKGQINQIIPMLRSFNKDNSIFYSLTFKDSDVRSTLLNHDISRKFYTMGLTKRINLNNILKNE